MDNEFRMKRNCLNCKNCNEDSTCKKDGENITFPFFQELKCCELKETAMKIEELMSIWRT